jgi:hypothetical protein
LAGIKTIMNYTDPRDFIESIEYKTRRDDGRVLLDLFNKWTGEEPKMWGPTIVGFGEYHYRYESGHEGDTCKVAFSPRKASISLYVNATHPDNEEFLQKLGKHKAGASCLYVNKLADINISILGEMVKTAYALHD